MARVSLAAPVSAVAGGKTAKALRDGLGIETVDDLLRHYPRRYIDPGELTDLDSLQVGEHVTVLAEVVSASTRRMQQRKGTVTEVVVSDGRGRISLVFFNQPWRVEREFRVGRRGLFAGTVSAYGGTRQLAHPRHVMIPDTGLHLVEESGDADRDREAEAAFSDLLIPIYPATAGLPSWRIQQTVRLALDSLTNVDDPLPPALRMEKGLLGLDDALRGIHRPPDREAIEAARRRLRFEEAFDLQVVLAQRRHERLAQAATPRPRSDEGLLAAFDNRTPYSLTSAQERVGGEIASDLSGSHPMQRLLQGDVGSGKTLVALRAMLQVVDAGAQAALLAPTEVLAQQHLRTIRGLLGPLAESGLLGSSDIGTRVAYLSGSQSARQRREELAAIASGEAGIVVGTHALLEDAVAFADLGLVVVDEQHRFGVEQRAALTGRGPGDTRPHVLVMTATPIPRTVAMTVFGDLDVSVIDEYPPGRGRIATHVVAPREHPAHLVRAWDRVREEVESGRRVFVVCPRIGDDSATVSSDEVEADAESSPDESPLSSVVDVTRALADRWLSGLRVGMLHGRMPAEDKDEAMRRFTLPGDDPSALDVLVSTTVIEVGVDVPEASMMVILDAERFGISQLHQLRGRIARGGGDGLCLLVTAAEPGSPARERLAAVASTTDGFALARVDLEARREGDILGTAQSGKRSSLRLLEVIRDESLVEEARQAAQAIVAEDPALTRHAALRERVRMLAADDRSDFLEKG